MSIESDARVFISIEKNLPGAVETFGHLERTIALMNGQCPAGGGERVKAMDFDRYLEE